MVKDCRRPFLLVILLAALPSTGWAQDVKTVLGKALNAIGSESVGTLQFSGSGSSYDDKAELSTLKSYTQQIDLAHTMSGIRAIRVQGTPPTEQVTDQNVSPNSPWNTQLEFWITPYGFLKAARADAATLETKSVSGVAYRIVTVMVPGNHKLVGYINDKDMVERVQAWTDNDVLIEGVYLDYEDFRGLEVPTIQIRNRGGNLTQIVIVKDARVLAI